MIRDFNRRDLLACAGAAGLLGFAIGKVRSQVPEPPVPTGTLRERADRKGLLCGSAVSFPALKDERLRKCLIDDCNILVPENELKWAVIQPKEGPINFEPAEAIFNFAKTNAMQMRGHTLTWYRDEPDWAVAKIAGMTPGKAGDFLYDYVHKVVSHWKGRILQWDVINEPVVATGKIVEKAFYGKLGEDYMDIALRATKDADPAALRMLNQTLIAQEWWWEDKQRIQTLDLVERLLKRGAPLQGFGYEAHMRTAYAFSERKWAAFLEELKQMDLKFMVTELDVDDSGTIGDVKWRDAEAAALAKSMLDVSFSFEHCLGVLTWGASDKHSWIRHSEERRRKDGAPQRPTPRDDDYRRKPLWSAIAQALDGAPVRRRAA
ncbi:MAG: endo-1,4-beta-xylanase [Sphingobium sp.]